MKKNENKKVVVDDSSIAFNPKPLSKEEIERLKKLQKQISNKDFKEYIKQ